MPTSASLHRRRSTLLASKREQMKCPSSKHRKRKKETQFSLVLLVLVLPYMFVPVAIPKCVLTLEEILFWVDARGWCWYFLCLIFGFYFLGRHCGKSQTIVLDAGAQRPRTTHRARMAVSRSSRRAAATNNCQLKCEPFWSRRRQWIQDVT